jgi:hypothetical protein
LVLAWIVVYLCVVKGIKSSGKVSESFPPKWRNKAFYY